jgi:hypothetical protein
VRPLLGLERFEQRKIPARLRRAAAPRGRLAVPLLVAFTFCILLAVHARWIFTHFSSDGYLCDSGWLAYLFEAGDPVLHNPSSINDRSFYAHHLSPHLFLFAAPFRILRFNGIEIFACHQGLFFGLFFVSLYLIVADARVRPRDRLASVLSVILVGGLSNALFQAAAYPHDEIAILAVSTLALAAWVSDHRGLFAFCLLWLPLIREDGGFYAAFTCLICIALEYGPRRSSESRTLRLGAIALGEVAASACALLLKARFFPGFDTFSFNFSGNGWDHVSSGLLADRLQSMLSNPNILPVLVGSVLLATLDFRYALGVVLMSPLYLLHLLAVSEAHGHFRLYFGLAWLPPMATWLAVFVNRSKSAAVGTHEAMIIFAFALAVSAPIHAAFGSKGQFWYVARWALERPVVNISSMQEFARWVRTNYSGDTADGATAQRHCASMGIAALIPNELAPDEVLDPNSDLATCRTVLLLRRDMHYDMLTERVQAEKFRAAGARYNAELWLRETNLRGTERTAAAREATRARKVLEGCVNR